MTSFFSYPKHVSGLSLIYKASLTKCQPLNILSGQISGTEIEKILLYQGRIQGGGVHPVCVNCKVQGD
jgi:hypothetical protein